MLLLHILFFYLLVLAAVNSRLHKFFRPKRIKFNRNRRSTRIDCKNGNPYWLNACNICTCSNGVLEECTLIECTGEDYYARLKCNVGTKWFDGRYHCQCVADYGSICLIEDCNGSTVAPTVKPNPPDCETDDSDEATASDSECDYDDSDDENSGNGGDSDCEYDDRDDEDIDCIIDDSDEEDCKFDDDDEGE